MYKYWTLDHSYTDIFNSKAQFSHSISDKKPFEILLSDVKHDHTYESTINSQHPSSVCNPIPVNIQTSCTKDEFATIYTFDKKDHNTSYEYGKNVSSVNKTNENHTFNTHKKSTTYFKIPKFNFSNIITIDKITYLVYDVAVGGNCFFNALSLGVSGNFKQGEIYRNLICKEIYDSYAYWEDKLKVSHFKNISPQKYWNSMVKGQNIAKSPEISVAAKTLNCNINVFIQHKCVYTT